MLINALFFTALLIIVVAQRQTETVLRCCREEGVRTRCLSLCTTDINLNSLFRNPLLGFSCLSDVPSLIKCGGDGRDSRGCCEKAGVPDRCRVFCYPDGSRIPNIRSLLFCLGSALKILTCNLLSKALRPGPPTGLQFEVDVKRNSKLTWHEPKQKVAFDSYQIVIRDASGVVVVHDELPYQEDVPYIHYSLKNLPNGTYSAAVRTKNNHGFSIYRRTSFLLNADPESSTPQDKVIHGTYLYDHRYHGWFSPFHHSGAIFNYPSDIGPHAVGADNALLQREEDRLAISHTQRRSFCRLPLATGNGHSQQTRYYYNPFLAQCQHFIYFGDGGNLNNFLIKNHCDEACGRSEKSGIPKSPFYERYEGHHNTIS